MSGPLSGVRVLEMAGIGPSPYCGMLLADMGATVVRIDRIEASGLGVAFPRHLDHLNRNKRSVAVDLKRPGGVEVVRRMAEQADILIEGFRPGVMEKLGLGPDILAERNPRLVYGRMTGWGQDGPLSGAAGHDLNYIAITGALAAIGEPGGAPVVPLNLIGDFGGGTLFLAMGILAAVVAARTTGRGQVVDAAIVDGVINMMTLHHAMHAMGQMSMQRGTNLLDGGAPFYAVYETADGLWISVAAVEPKFYRILIDRMGIASPDLPAQYDQTEWPRLRGILSSTFAQRTRAEWCDLLEGTDACFAPVLDLTEAAAHHHNVARANHLKIDAALIPAAAPRFVGSPPPVPTSASLAGYDTLNVLGDWSFSCGEVEALLGDGVILQRRGEGEFAEPPNP